jgi:hypothetical protein
VVNLKFLTVKKLIETIHENSVSVFV